MNLEAPLKRTIPVEKHRSLHVEIRLGTLLDLYHGDLGDTVHSIATHTARRQSTTLKEKNTLQPR